jgi:DNA-binding transcriptional MerR regulator
MRSSELASLAGVTVRALRHYHHVGVLSEPPRTGNGYRRYTVHDLIRVLRIKRLAALGMSLDQMPSILDSADEDHDDLLKDLECELDAKIALLTRQKALLGIIRDCETSPDVPPELARFVRAFALAGHSGAIKKVDREQTILIAHFFGETGIERLIRFYERVAALDIVELNRRFDRLKADTSPAVIDRLVADFIQQAAMIIQEFNQQNEGVDLIDDGLTELLYQYVHDAMNPAQEAVIIRIIQRLEPSTRAASS